MQHQDENGGRDGAIVFGAAKAPTAARLLVIDDVAVHRMIICKAAQKVGYATYEANDVAEALASAAGLDLTCITLDLSLGERAGVEVLRRLSEFGRKTPIIVISGADTKGTQAAVDFGLGLGLSMLPPISKPVDLIRLRETLADVELKWRVHQNSFASVA